MKNYEWVGGNMNLKERNQKLYQAAYDYLEHIKPPGVVLDMYFRGANCNYQRIEDIFIRFIASAQNYQRMPNVIAFEKREKEISRILEEYDVQKIAKMDVQNLYQRFRAEFAVTSPDNKRNSWYKWSCSVVDSAKYLRKFETIADFDKYVMSFDRDATTRIELSQEIQAQIRGIGFALACDILKELGYTNYSKPDVHMMDIFSSLGLCERTQVSTFEAIDRMADDSKEIDPEVTPYKVDKIFWLICSGVFYKEKPVMKIKGQKKDLIDCLKHICSENVAESEAVSNDICVLNPETIRRIRKFSVDREWDQFHTPGNLAKSIAIEAAELLECFQWSEKADLEHVKEELADVIVYCQNMLDELQLDVNEIVNAKMAKNEAKYPIEKSR